MSAMKQRSTTPVFKKGTAKKAIIVACAVMVFAAIPMSISQRADADSYDDKMAALQRQINTYQAQADALSKQAASYRVELDRLTVEKNAIQAQLDLSQAQYDKLQADIAANEKKLVENRDALGTTLADIYVNGEITPLEMIASSSNIGDFLDQQEYRKSIRDTLSTTINEIQTLKKKLETDKAAVEVVLERQKAQRNSLAAKEAQQADLYNKTKGEEAAYQNIVAKQRSELQSVAAQQRAYYESLRSRGNSISSGVIGSFSYSNFSGNMGCAGGYPYCMPLDSYVDPWQLYNRECVSYVAWALQNRFGKYVAGFNGSGNAYEWVWSAPQYSGATRTYDPQPGDAVILPRIAGLAPWGHAMIVESVSGDTVHISQYNFYGTGEYSTMDIAKTGVVFLRFQDR